MDDGFSGICDGEDGCDDKDDDGGINFVLPVWGKDDTRVWLYTATDSYSPPKPRLAGASRQSMNSSHNQNLSYFP